MLVVLIIASLVLVVAAVQKTRVEQAAAVRAATAYTAPGAGSSSPSRSVIAVIGDESVDGAAAGVTAGDRWTSLLGARLGVGVVVLSSAGSGYATAGQSGSSFAQLVEEVPSAARAVIFVGGAADADVAPLALARAATEVFSSAAERASGAEVIAVGPLFRPSGVGAAELDTIRTAQRSAASIAEARWVDPVGAKWISGVRGVEDLDASDQRRIATRILAILDPAAAQSSAAPTSSPTPTE